MFRIARRDVGGSAQGASPSEPGDARHPSRPEERYREEQIRLPADKDAKLAFLREALEKEAARGWRLISATQQQSAYVLLVTWDTQGALSD